MNTVEHLKVDLLKGRYLKVDCWSKIPGGTHEVGSVVTTRLGGFSAAPYDSFNLAHHVWDAPEAVKKNRQLVRSDLGLEHLCFMNQTHSNKVLAVTRSDLGHWDVPFDCDGLVTNLPGVALAVMTADCLPLLLCDAHNGVIGAVHCGWMGLKLQIIAEALKQMELLGADLSRIEAYLGPAIGPKSFEVGPEVKAAFEECNPVCCEAFVPGRPEHFMGDLYQLARIFLRKYGATGPISGGCYDTFTQNDLFYSYRKAHDTGRMASIIWLQ